MKIAFVLDDSLDPPDGVQQYVLALGRELARRGHEVHYLVGQTDRRDIANVHSLARNVRVRFNHNRVGMPLPVSRRQIRELLTKEKFDVLHIQAPFSPLFAARVIKAASRSTRVIGTFHIAPHSKLVSLGTAMLGRVTRGALKRFDAMVAVSPVAADFAQRSFGLDSVVIPNPVKIDKFSVSRSSEKLATASHSKTKNVVFLGRLVERKGAGRLLDAVRLAEKKPGWPKNVKVTIAGDGPLRQRLEQAAARLQTHVEFLGFINETDKPSLLSNADVVVYPATGGESFGIVLIEAMAAGAKVVLAGDNPGYRSTMADNNDLLFDPHNSDELADRLLCALTDKKFATSAHAWQTKHVKQFDISNVADKILKAYGTM